MPDPVRRRVNAILDQQQAKGLRKYGVGLANAGLTPLQLVRHAAEEAADLLFYLSALQVAMEAKTSRSPKATRSASRGSSPAETCGTAKPPSASEAADPT